MTINDDAVNQAIGLRIKEIRGEHTQPAFLEALFRTTGRKISQAALSRMENGKEHASPADLHALAEMDPRRRGAQWLMFGTPGRASRSQPAGADEETPALDIRSAQKLQTRVSRPGRPADGRRKGRGGSGA